LAKPQRLYDLLGGNGVLLSVVRHAGSVNNADVSGGPRDDTAAMRKILELGGLFSAVVLIAFGIGAIATGIDGRSTVKDTLKQEQIKGTPDMTPALTKKAVAEAGIASTVTIPTCSVANQPVNDGDSARCFASYMRIHALEATGGLTFSQLPRFATADGKGTSDETKALKSPKGQPVDNPIRNVWITETALSTALNTSYMAERISLFGIVTGIAMLLAGIGLGILSLFVFGALKLPRRREDEAPVAQPAKAVPVA